MSSAYGDITVPGRPELSEVSAGIYAYVQPDGTWWINNTGFLVGQTQTFPEGVSYDEYRIGGTSLSSPIFAGLMALADQMSGSPHGFANPLFYAHPSAFYDVQSVKTAVARRNFNNGVDTSAGTADRLRTFDDYSGSPTQQTGPGWDNVTGLGSPKVGFLTAIGA
jgi:subtilase family serine protease